MQKLQMCDYWYNISPKVSTIYGGLKSKQNATHALIHTYKFPIPCSHIHCNDYTTTLPNWKLYLP